MADLKTVLGDYGADYERTMARFMGSEDLYLKILAMLPRDEEPADAGASIAGRGPFRRLRRGPHAERAWRATWGWPPQAGSPAPSWNRCARERGRGLRRPVPGRKRKNLNGPPACRSC